MAKSKIKAGKRTTTDRGRARAAKSGVSKTRKPGSREPKPAQTDPLKRKPLLQPQIARLKRQLKAARTQQQASAEILRAVASASGDAAGPLQLIAETTARLFEASSVSIQLAEGSEFTQEYRVGAIAKRIGSAYPRSNIKVGGRNLPGTVVAENRQIHIPDLDRLDSSMSDFPGLPHARAGGARTVCGTPLRRERKSIGALIVFRDRLLPFTDDELALLQSFAAQAVIAIENARLFNESREALERQVATADILRIISRSVAHAAPVFDTILESCQRLFNPFDAAVYLVEGDRVRGVARRGPGVGDWGVDSMPLAGSSTGLAIAQRRPLHFPDLADKADLPEDKREAVRLAGGMSVLYAPIISESRGVGSLVVTRQPRKPFTETEIGFIQSFADQAAIAIENARLFNETKEALERQTATAEILSVMSSSPTDVTPVFEAIAERARELSGSRIGSAVRFDGELLHMIAFRGSSPEGEAAMHAAFPMKPGNGSLNARVIAGLVPLQIPDVDLDPAYQLGDVARKGDFRALLAVPMIHDGRAIGAIGVGRDEPGLFPERIVTLLQTFASQAVIAIENVRLFNETREALERQTATADILKVIASSPSDVQPVFEAISERSNRLVGGLSSAVYAIVEDVMHLMAFTRTSPEADAAIQASFPRPLSEAPWADQIRNGEIVEIPDAEIEWVDHPALLKMVRLRGFRGQLLVPLLRDGKTVGLISVTRKQPGTFAPHHVQLLQSFADQAVIAIENVRLFDEVQAKTGDLEESLQQQTATADVLKVISRSAFDLQTVLETLARSAVELSSARRGTVFLRDGDLFRFRAASHPDLNEDWIRFMNGNPQQAGRHSTIGRAIASARSVCTPDVEADPEIRMPAYLAGIRAVLAVPLLRDGKVEGVMALSRQEPGEFTARQIELVETFADQAVIAIENTRLFNETREALERQTATAEILKVIASSPDDVQPVFQAIAERSNHLVGGFATTVVSIIDDVVHLSAFTPTTPAADAALRAFYPRPLSGFTYSDAVRRGDIHGIVDTEVELAGESDQLTMVRQRGWRSALWVPLLLEGEAIGVIGVTRVEPGPFADHYVEMLKTFADQAVIAISNVRLFRQVQERTRELSRSLDDLRTAQDRLVQTEKLASLGQLTAGIAHEIKNPLNFVNNFSALSVELIDEMTDVFENSALDEAGRRKELDEIRELLKSNLEKVVQHGKRADSIVKNMLLHSREGSGEQRSVDINALLDESLNLAYHGARAEKPGFNITLQRDLDPDAGVIEVFPQEITRALLNLISNGFYAASKREAENGEANFEPVLSAATKNFRSHVEIRIRDNGTGIPPEVKEKMFNPFFTTKPAGEGTGLGLSMSHDIIVKQHGGRIEVDTQPGQFTEFTIVLPRASNIANNGKN